MKKTEISYSTMEEATKLKKGNDNEYLQKYLEVTMRIKIEKPRAYSTFSLDI